MVKVCMKVEVKFNFFLNNQILSIVEKYFDFMTNVFKKTTKFLDINHNCPLINYANKSFKFYSLYFDALLSMAVLDF